MGDHAVAVASSGTENIRTRQRTISAVSYDEQYVIPIEERVVSFSGFANSFRIPARAATTEPLVTIWNASSTTLVVVQAMMIDVETIVAKTAINPIVHAYRMTTAPSNGT